MFETWVSKIIICQFIEALTDECWLNQMVTVWSEVFPLNQQEDDMDGIHIVAFAEEEDPGDDLKYIILLQHLHFMLTYFL